VGPKKHSERISAGRLQAGKGREIVE